MTPYALLQTVLTAVANDQDVAEYAVIEYGRLPGVYDRHSGEFPPEPELCPYILIHGAGKTAGQESREVAYRLSVDIFVYDTEDEVRADDASLSSGPRRLAGLQERVLSAILSGLPEYLFSGISQDDEAADLYPLMVSAMDLTFVERIMIGQNPLSP